MKKYILGEPELEVEDFFALNVISWWKGKRKGGDEMEYGWREK